MYVPCFSFTSRPPSLTEPPYLPYILTVFFNPCFSYPTRPPSLTEPLYLSCILTMYDPCFSFPSRPPSLTELAAAKEKSDLMRQQGEHVRKKLTVRKTLEICNVYFLFLGSSKSKLVLKHENQGKTRCKTVWFNCLDAPLNFYPCYPAMPIVANHPKPFPKETSQDSGEQKKLSNTKKNLSLLNFCKSSALIP